MLLLIPFHSSNGLGVRKCRSPQCMLRHDVVFAMLMNLGSGVPAIFHGRSSENRAEASRNEWVLVRE